MNSVTGFGSIIVVLVNIYSFVILARVLMSWINVDPYSPLARVIYDLTEPVLAPARNLLPPAAGLDFSPIIVLVVLQILGTMLANMFP
jgi:YggT family protein